jgi:C1A family cysteine protease
MRTVLRVSACLAVAAAAGSPPDYELAFRDFKVKFQRSYGSPEEESRRLEIFTANLRYIESANSRKLSYELEVNEFADQSPEEFSAARFGMRKPPPAKRLWQGAPYLGSDAYSGAALPSSVDWSQKGAVTPPKNQAQCGSCWAFSTTGAVEGAWAIATGQLLSLSEQQLVDCDKTSMGCNGGEMDTAFQFLHAHGVCTEESYAYHAKGGKCQEGNCTQGIPSGGIAGFKDVPTDDEEALMEAVAQQPVAIAIEADQMAFQLYSKGILTKKCGDKLDHGVLAVGYGEEAGVPYWKVKNSWGASWGEEGYIRIERGLKKDGECGINAQPSYPVVKESVEIVV